MPSSGAGMVSMGYRSMRRLLSQRDREALANIVGMLHRQDDASPYRAFMPPLVGNEEERQALVEYLATLTQAPGGAAAAP